MAGFRLGFFLALLALGMVAESTSPPLRDFQSNVAGNSSFGDDTHLVGHVGDYIEPREEMMMESDYAPRNLAAEGSHISYDALYANMIPCSKRGNSYYNCGTSGKVNPYSRGCTAVTRCARR